MVDKRSSLEKRTEIEKMRKGFLVQQDTMCKTDANVVKEQNSNKQLLTILLMNLVLLLHERLYYLHQFCLTLTCFCYAK